MNYMLKGTILLVIAAFLSGCLANNKSVIKSPDGTIGVLLNASQGSSIKETASLSIEYMGRKVLLPSSLEITLRGIDLSKNLKVIRTESSSKNDSWTNSFGERREVPENYNQVKFFLKSDQISVNLICRVYNEGAAFAW
jgi:alpha-glucosidase